MSFDLRGQINTSFPLFCDGGHSVYLLICFLVYIYIHAVVCLRVLFLTLLFCLTATIGLCRVQSSSSCVRIGVLSGEAEPTEGEKRVFSWHLSICVDSGLLNLWTVAYCEWRVTAPGPLRLPRAPWDLLLLRYASAHPAFACNRRFSTSAAFRDGVLLRTLLIRLKSARGEEIFCTIGTMRLVNPLSLGAAPAAHLRWLFVAPMVLLCSRVWMECG